MYIYICTYYTHVYNLYFIIYNYISEKKEKRLKGFFVILPTSKICFFIHKDPYFFNSFNFFAILINF